MHNLEGVDKHNHVILLIRQCYPINETSKRDVFPVLAFLIILCTRQPLYAHLFFKLEILKWPEDDDLHRMLFACVSLIGVKSIGFHTNAHRKGLKLRRSGLYSGLIIHFCSRRNKLDSAHHCLKTTKFICMIYTWNSFNQFDGKFFLNCCYLHACLIVPRPTRLLVNSRLYTIWE